MAVKRMVDIVIAFGIFGILMIIIALTVVVDQDRRYWRKWLK